jgi:hypothetical protein
MIAEVMASLSPPVAVETHFRDTLPVPKPRTARTSFLAKKVAAATAAGAIAIGGLGAAAYANGLPDAVQNVAHHLIGAPAAHDGRGKTSPHAPAGPNPNSNSGVSPSPAVPGGGRSSEAPTPAIGAHPPVRPDTSPHPANSHVPGSPTDGSTATPTPRGASPTPPPTPTKSHGRPTKHQGP